MTTHLRVYFAAVLFVLSLAVAAQTPQGQYGGSQVGLQFAEMEKQCAQLSARVKTLQDYYASVVESINELNKALVQERQKNAQLEKEIAELRKLVDSNQKDTVEAMAQLVDTMAKETANVINSAMKTSGGGVASSAGIDFDEYKVQPGATLHTIAKAYGVSVEAIQKANNLKGDSIKEGQLLKIPKKK